MHGLTSRSIQEKSGNSLTSVSLSIFHSVTKTKVIARSRVSPGAGGAGWAPAGFRLCPKTTVRLWLKVETSAFPSLFNWHLHLPKILCDREIFDIFNMARGKQTLGKEKNHASWWLFPIFLGISARPFACPSVFPDPWSGYGLESMEKLILLNVKMISLLG